MPDSDYVDVNQKAIISSSLANRLFISEDCTGQSIFINYVQYTIVGVCSGKDDFVFLPARSDDPISFFAISEDSDLPSYVRISKWGGSILDKVSKYYVTGSPEFFR